MGRSAQSNTQHGKQPHFNFFDKITTLSHMVFSRYLLGNKLLVVLADTPIYS
jgi:hypothetical protein